MLSALQLVTSGCNTLRSVEGEQPALPLALTDLTVAQMPSGRSSSRIVRGHEVHVCLGRELICG